LGKLANLSKLKEAVKIENQSKKEEVKEEKKEYSILTDIHIDLDAFQAAMDAYLARLKQANKHNLVSILESSKHTFTHNCWHLTVPEFAGLEERDQEMLPFLRERLNQPNLYVELKVGAAFVNPNDTRPYTEEEKLKEMGLKNPALLELQKKFKTRIIY